MKPFPTTLLGSALVFFAACGDDDVSSPIDGGPDATTPAVRAIFQPVADPMPFGALPFPDDLYLDASGHVALGEYPNEASEFAVGYMASLREGLATLDGFGVVSPVFFPLDGAIDPASLPVGPDGSLAEAATVFLVDAEPASPTAFGRVPATVHWLAQEQMISVRPGVPLRPGHRYAAVVTSGVLDTTGQPLGSSPSFEQARAEMAPTEPLLAEAHAEYASVLANLDVERVRVAALAVFRVQTATDDLALVREQLQATVPEVAVTRVLSGSALDELLGVPVVNALGRDNEGGLVHDAIGFVVDGTIEVPNYLNETANVHGRFERADSGGVATKRVDSAPFTLVLPAGVAQPPVVIFQHGVTAERSDVFGVANTLAAAGYATVAIDAPWHGMRAAVPNPDMAHNFTDLEEPDGFGDIGGMGIIIDFAGLADTAGPYVGFHPIYFRDALRQGAADLLVLARAIRASDWTGAGEFEPMLSELAFSEGRLAFIGNSLGGIMGAMFVASEPEVGAAVLTVTGGHLSLAVQDSFSFNGVYLGQLFPLLALHDVADIDYAAKEPLLYPGFALWQIMLDAGDSISYGQQLQEGDANLLLHMVRNDETVPNRSTEFFARALGVPALGGMARYVALPVAEAPLRGNVMVGDTAVTRGLQIFETGSHGSLLDGLGRRRAVAPVEPPFVRMDEVESENPINEIHGQIVAFLESWRAGNAEIAAPE